MRYHKFRIDVFYPPEYRQKFHEILSEEEKTGDVSYQLVIEESAPPPEMLKDAVIVLASALTILKILYDFHKEIKNKKGKVYLTSKGQKFDLEAYNLDEVKIKIGEPSVKRYRIKLSFPNLPPNEVKRAAATLSFRPISFNGEILSPDNEVQFADYDDASGKIKTTIHVSNEKVNELYERGVSLYATAEPKKIHEGTALETTLFLNLMLSTRRTPSASKIEEY
jgi:hypothetical protein